MIITRTSRPFGRSAPQFTAGDVVKGISRLVRSETGKTFSFGYGVRRQMCSGVAVVRANDGTDCGDGGGQPVCVARSEGRTFEIPCQLGSGGAGGGLTTTLGRRSFYSGKVFVFRDSACATIRVYSMAGVYLGTWRYLTGGVYTCQNEDETNEAYWARHSDAFDPPAWFPKVSATPHPGEVDDSLGTPTAMIGHRWMRIGPPTTVGQHRKATMLGDYTGGIGAVAYRCGTATTYPIYLPDLATLVRPDLRDPNITAESALGGWLDGFTPKDPEYVVGYYVPGSGETVKDLYVVATLPDGITDANGNVVSDLDGTLWVHAINPAAARVTLHGYDPDLYPDPSGYFTVNVSLGAGMFLDSIQIL